jgi:hypothetical protein
MRLRTRQRWALASMERKLRASEPRLAARFAMFTRLTCDEAPGGAEAMSGYRSRRKRSRLLAYLSVALTACVALAGLGVAVTSSGSPSCASASAVPLSDGTGSTPAACRLLPPQDAAFRVLGGH